MPSNVSILDDDSKLTLDMVGQYTFCPRRFHLMYVEGRWDENAYTVEGRHVHRRVDQLDHLLFSALQANGDHAQYSVFFCQLNPTELAMLRSTIQPIIHQEEDQVLILDLGKVQSDDPPRVESIGKVYKPPVRTMIV